MSGRWWSWPWLLTFLLGAGMVLAAAGARWGSLDPDRGAALEFSALSKLLLLAAAAGYGVACARKIRSRAWRLMATGFVAYALGQACLVVYQLWLHVPTPFPSWADLFFVSGSLVLIVALWALLAELASSGCPLNLRRRLPLNAVWILGLGSVGAWWVLRTLISGSGIDRDALLSLIYPFSDLLLLIPALLLYQVTGPFRGGRLRQVWATLLAGMVLFLVGDLLFSVLTGESAPWLVWAVDMAFIGGYALVARACALQYELMR